MKRRTFHGKRISEIHRQTEERHFTRANGGNGEVETQFPLFAPVKISPVLKLLNGIHHKRLGCGSPSLAYCRGRLGSVALPPSVGPRGSLQTRFQVGDCLGGLRMAGASSGRGIVFRFRSESLAPSGRFLTRES